MVSPSVSVKTALEVEVATHQMARICDVAVLALVVSSVVVVVKVVDVVTGVVVIVVVVVAGH